MTDDDTPAGEPATGPTGGPVIRRRRVWRRAAVGAVVVAAVAAVTALTAGAVMAAQGGEAPANAADVAGAGSPGTGAGHAHEGSSPGDDAAGPAGGDHRTRARHRHDPLPPYEQRYADATEDERRAADELLASVRSALAPYADVDAAVAAGYQAPRRPRGPTMHYVDRSVAEEGRVLDPSRPNGLVYGTGPAGEPVLLGAFFVAPPGTPAPSPAGDLVVWHSHAPSCPAFFATADEPCTDAHRMLHVWTVDRVELSGRRDQPIDVEVVDPFGAPFRASVARAG
jgi:hypothetical protein